MTGFRGRLRQFVSKWLPSKEVSPQNVEQASASFVFNADDTPRLWSEDVGLHWPPVSNSWPQREFPKFMKSATSDADRMAA
jgi:hypothetical protein